MTLPQTPWEPVSVWLLATGFWDDDGDWLDDGAWLDDPLWGEVDA